MNKYLSILFSTVKIVIKLLPLFGYVAESMKEYKLKQIREAVQETYAVIDVITIALRDKELSTAELEHIKERLEELKKYLVLFR